jgi:hypothetical protein
MSGSDGPKEARVEVLRAEVRVLMVGSRQVTLSVARQLDAVEPGKVEPFGRVRIDKDPTGQVIEVVGSADGVLARSATSRERYRCPRDHGGRGGAVLFLSDTQGHGWTRELRDRLGRCPVRPRPSVGSGDQRLHVRDGRQLSGSVHRRCCSRCCFGEPIWIGS